MSFKTVQTAPTGALEESPFRLLADRSPAPCVLLGGDGSNIWCNHTWHDLCASAPETMMGGGWAALHDPLALAPLFQAVQASAWEAKPLTLPLSLRTAGGGRRRFRATFHPCRNLNGRVGRWAGIYESAAEAGPPPPTSPSALEALEAAKEGCVLVDAAMFVHFANAAAADLLGGRPTLGRPLPDGDGVTGRELEELLAPVFEDGEAGAAQEREWPAAAPAGRGLFGRAVRMTGGAALFLEDLAEVKVAGGSGPRGRLLEAVVHGAPGVIYAKDLMGRVILANDGSRRFFDRDPEACIGLTFEEILSSPHETAALKAFDEKVTASGEAGQIEIELSRKTGGSVYWLLHKAPLRDAVGTIYGLSASALDVTARKRAERRERALAAEVENRTGHLLGLIDRLVEFSGHDEGAIRRRIRALSRLNEVLSARQWQNMTLAVLAEAALEHAPAAGERLRASGPEVSLSPSAAKEIGLLLHELVAHAGAVEDAAGQAALTWRPGSDSGLRLTFVESSGAAPTAGALDFAARWAETILGGRFELEPRDHGLACRIEIPGRRLG